MRHTLRSIVSGHRRYASWDKTQLIQLFVTSVAIGFVFSYRKWGSGEEWVLFEGLFNWAMYSIFALLALFFMHLGVRVAAIEMGYKPIFHNWTLGIVASISATFLTNGGGNNTISRKLSHMQQ